MLRVEPSKSQLKVFITSCEVGRGAWRTHEEKLKHLYELSDKRYGLADRPESSDVILIGNVREEDWARRIRGHKLINRYPHKSFSMSDADRPLVLHHGMYTSGVKSIFNLGRVRTGSYTLYSDEYLNPYIQAHQCSEQSAIKKEYLLVFIGRRNFEPPRAARLRDAIFNLKFERPDILIEDSSSFKRWSLDNDKVEALKRQKHYYDRLVRSKFSLCPRGDGTNSLRLFESMQLGVAPVIVSDQWILPTGPKWDEFSIAIKEKHIRNVEKIVRAHENDFKTMGDLARRAYEGYFSDPVYFNYVVDNCLDIVRRQVIPEAVCWRLNALVIAGLKAREQLRSRARVVRSCAKRVLARVIR